MKYKTQSKRIAKILESIGGKAPNTKYDDDIKRIADALEHISLNGGFGDSCSCDETLQNYYNKNEVDEILIDLMRSQPVILNISNITIDEGDGFDPMAGVQAFDHEGDDITSLVNVHGLDDFDPNIPGVYTLTYSVIDDRGKSTDVERTVTVAEWKVEDYATVLFEDGHLMINEKKSNREADIAIHGAVKEEYTPWDKKNPVTPNYNNWPWASSRNLITSCSAGSAFKPKRTDYMFADCTNLTSLDVSNWDMSALENAAAMFGRCQKLTTLDVSNWDTSALENAGDMFYDCRSLTTLDVSNWDTSALQKASSMFYDCQSLTTLDVSNWDTSALQNAISMFADCTNLTTLDVSNWDTSALEDAMGMFYTCTSLTTLDVSNWDTSALQNASSMFYDCTNLTTVDVSNWDTSALQITNYMFDGCRKLTTLDISSWDNSKGTEMIYMFSDCDNLKTIYATDKFKNFPDRNIYNMFLNSTSLVGGAGTTYDSTHVNNQYARIDDPDNGKPGYFTLKET